MTEKLIPLHRVVARIARKHDLNRAWVWDQADGYGHNWMYGVGALATPEEAREFEEFCVSGWERQEATA